MPLLMFFYIHESNNISFAIVLAMILSWCGDILLVNPEKFRLYAGVLSFLAAHILYIFVFIGLVSEVNVMVFIFSLFLILSSEYLFVRKLNVPNSHKFPIIIIIIYGIAIALLVVFSLQVFICYRNISGILLVVGAVLFFISDTVLVYFNMIKIMTKNPLTIVMLSYIIAQACIVIGCMNI
jgi:uncharacterized membrane protein YhhN